MARKRKSRCKDSTSLIKATKGVADIGKTSTTSTREKQAVSGKRKSLSETPRRRKRSKRCKKVKSSHSVELVGVSPCCASIQERKKYAKLGLDSALFFSNSKPAKRKQSHISVITISSSDDEDLSNDKTADWISKMDIGTINLSSTEEPFPSGDADFLQSDCMIEEILDAERFRPQRSTTQICSTPESIFQPLFASTPKEKPSVFQPLCLSMSEKEEDRLYRGPSFLENPIKNLRQKLLTFHVAESLNTIASAKQNQGTDESPGDKSHLAYRSCSPKFYFGPSQNVQTLQETFDNSESTAPMWSDMSYFSTTQTSNTDANNVDKELEGQETEARSYSLEQVPSTSHAPVSVPVLEVAPKKKNSKSRNTFPSK